MNTGPAISPPEIRRCRKYRYLSITVLAAIMVLSFVMLMPFRGASPDLAFSLTGYTNLFVLLPPPKDHAWFALPSLLNKDSVPIRLQASWIEIEGDPTNRLAFGKWDPPWSRSNLLGPGSSVTMMLEAPVGGRRWRLNVVGFRLTLKRHAMEFAALHRALPSGIQRVVIPRLSRAEERGWCFTNTSNWFSPPPSDLQPSATR